MACLEKPRTEVRALSEVFLQQRYTCAIRPTRMRSVGSYELRSSILIKLFHLMINMYLHIIKLRSYEIGFKGNPVHAIRFYCS